MSVTTFQGFLQTSLESSSSLGGPTLQQMAALAAYSKVAMIAQREQKIFTPTIYSQMASAVLSNPYPAVYYADRFYPLHEINTSTVNINHDETISDNENNEDTKEFNSSTCSEDTLDVLQTSLHLNVNDKAVKLSTDSFSTEEPKLSSTTQTILSENKKRNYKLPQRYTSEDFLVNEEKEFKVPDEDEYYDDDEDDGPPVLQKITPLEMKANKKSAKTSVVETLSTDGFKHPKKSITFEKVVTPQLLPNGFFTSQELVDPTQPLEEWFLSNLTNPFPTQKQFDKLQYSTNFGHLDIRSWFQNRRKKFCKQNPKARPWSKKSVPVKRLSASSSAENSDENSKKQKSIMDEMVAKKLKTIKLEVSELEYY